jgi:Flp pilus assembly protein TadD
MLAEMTAADMGEQAELLHLLGTLLVQTGRAGEGAGFLREAVALEPTRAASWSNLSQALLKTGDSLAALAAAREAHKLEGNADNTLNLGLALDAAGHLRQAIEALAAVLQHNRATSAAWINLLQILMRQGRHDEAARLAPSAAAACPDKPDVIVVAAQALYNEDRNDEAALLCRQALAAGLTSPKLMATYGIALVEGGHIGEARNWLTTAATQNPQDPEIMSALATTLLSAGVLKQGFVCYEARLAHSALGKARANLPNSRRWRGESLAGQSLCVLAEQGLGDSLQFLRFAPALLARGASEVQWEMNPRLFRLAATLGSDQDRQGLKFVAPRSARGTRYYTHLMSLPALFGIASDADIQALPQPPYLRAEAALASLWQERLDRQMPREGGRRPRVGLAWQGNPNYGGDRKRSLPLISFAPLADRASLLALQQGKGQEMRADWLQRPQAPIDAGEDGFVDTAAIMANCDLVITSCTSIAHLAGALGRPVWIALAYAPDWRWQLGRNDSPWYPTARLFRQPRPGDWGSVIAAMGAALDAGEWRPGPD